MLLKNKKFFPIFITQMFGCFNDNLLKFAVVTAINFTLNIDTGTKTILTHLISILFISPFIIFSGIAGQFADKYRRDKIAQVLKWTELAIIITTAALVYLEIYSPMFLMIFLMTAQSTFYGPVKYSLLPQHFNDRELISANALIDTSTYVTILLGTIVGTYLTSPFVILMFLLVAAVFGLLGSLNMPASPAPRPDTKIDKNIFKYIYSTCKKTAEIKSILRATLGTTWFWTYGAVILALLTTLSSEVLKLSQVGAVIFMFLFSVGMGIGTYICTKIMRGIIHATYVPISSFIMGILTFFLYLLTRNYVVVEESANLLTFFTSKTGILISVVLLLMSLFAGIYLVPLNAFIQTKSPKKYLATIIAGGNIISSAGMVLFSLFVIILTQIGVSIPQVFLLISIISVLVAGYIATIIPDALPRSIAQSLLSFFYKVDVTGLENYEKAGKKVLIIANHTSLLDGLLVASFMPEKVIFAINTTMLKKWWVKIFRSVVTLYPIDPTNPLALKHLISSIKKNQKCMIFPEGRITVTGSLMKVYEGAGFVAIKSNANILPVRIDGTQYSKFSYLKGKVKTKYFPKIRLTILPHKKLVASKDEDAKGMTSSEKRKDIGEQLYKVMAGMMFDSSPMQNGIFDALLKAKKTYGSNHMIVEDIGREPLTYSKFILKSYVFGEAIKKHIKKDNVAILLPNTIVATVVFFGLQSIGKVPAMINFTHGVNQILSCLETSEVKTIITSRQFLEAVKLDDLHKYILRSGVKIIFLEDFKNKVNIIHKIKGFYKNFFKIKKEMDIDSPAVILFTSGTEGKPKGVVLSHRNLQSNRFQIMTVLSFTSNDIMFNALPLFHSFGLSVGLITPILCGVKTFLYPSPLHYKIVPELVYDSNSSIICGTDTFFAGYAKKANSYDFFNIKYAIAGAEKLKESTYYNWMEKFGIRILEGYGVTEASPVISVNTPMYQKKGTVGKFLPGIEYKLEKIPDLEKGGQLFIKGQNIMRGYLRLGKIIPPEDGWYNTGDIVDIDSEGYITILGRMKRFAKIAGEMVSLMAIENIINKYIPDYKSAVISIPSEKKGEELIVLTSKKDLTTKELLDYFKKFLFSELWVPKRIIFLEDIPVLNTGKTDYVKISELASKLIDNQNNQN